MNADKFKKILISCGQSVKKATLLLDSDYKYYMIACNMFSIDTIEEHSHFLGQCLHESGNLNYTKEIWTNSSYQKLYEGSKKLGNIFKGDGKKYLGRGAIQTTGRKNYQIVKDKIGIDCIENPDLLLLPEYYWKASALYFSTNCLSFCKDVSRESCESVTRAINGKRMLHLERRIVNTNICFKILSNDE